MRNRKFCRTLGEIDRLRSMAESAEGKLVCHNVWKNKTRNNDLIVYYLRE